MSTVVYNTVQQCSHCLQVGKKVGQQRQLQLLPQRGSVEPIAIDILHPLPKTYSGSQFVAIISNRYSKLTCAVPTSNISSTQVADIFSTVE